MSILQTVATVRDNGKDKDFFLLFSIYLLPFLELASLNYRQSCENDFGQYFDEKKRNPVIKFCQKMIL